MASARNEDDEGLDDALLVLLELAPWDSGRLNTGREREVASLGEKLRAFRDLARVVIGACVHYRMKVGASDGARSLF